MASETPTRIIWNVSKPGIYHSFKIWNLEHSEIAEMSNEIDTVDQKTKSQKDASSDPVSSESNESDYIDDQNNR